MGCFQERRWSYTSRKLLKTPYISNFSLCADKRKFTLFPSFFLIVCQFSNIHTTFKIFCCPIFLHNKIKNNKNSEANTFSFYFYVCKKMLISEWYICVRLFTSSDTFSSAIFILNHTFLAYFYHLYIQTYTCIPHASQTHNTGRKQVCWKSFSFSFFSFLFCFILF